jgi:hypothetical protein
VVYVVLEAARLGVFKCIDTFYNSVRLHRTPNCQSPDQCEAAQAPAIVA